MSIEKLTQEPIFISAVVKNYPHQMDIYLVKSIDQLKTYTRREILPETIREFGKWYEVIPHLERLDLLGVAEALRRGLKEPYRITTISSERK